jgi:phosphomannomutase
VAKILIALSRDTEKMIRPGDLIKKLREPQEAREFRIPIKSDDYRDYGKEILDKLEQFSASQSGWTKTTENYEGIRIQCDDSHGAGWFLLRLSLHDPILPLNIESNMTGGVSFILSRLKNFFKDFQDLNLETLA